MHQQFERNEGLEILHVPVTSLERFHEKVPGGKKVHTLLDRNPESRHLVIDVLVLEGVFENPLLHRLHGNVDVTVVIAALDGELALPLDLLAHDPNDLETVPADLDIPPDRIHGAEHLAGDAETQDRDHAAIPLLGRKEESARLHLEPRDLQETLSDAHHGCERLLPEAVELLVGHLFRNDRSQEGTCLQ